MSSDNNARDALTSRVKLDEMTMSTGSNPLTAPLPIARDLKPADRAIKRFAVEGNAIITGGAGNLGLEAARAVLEHGASGVSLFDLNPAQSQEAIDALQSEFPDQKVITKKVNVADEDAIGAAVAETAKELGSVNILLCFAGVVQCMHAVDMSSKEWRRTLDINTTGSWLCAQAAARQMIKQKSGGSIVFTASISAHRVNFPQPQVAYNVSKGALLQLKNSLAAEWAHHGIRVNSISPGYMDTILNEGDGLEDAKRSWYERNPFGRMGHPQELTGPVVLLCSGAGKYINGADLLVDGGGSVF